MSSAKQLLQHAVASGLLTKDQAAQLYKIRHAHPDTGVEQLGVEQGFLTVDQAKRLRVEMEKADVPRELGGYRIIEKVGAGAMATVYKAKQLSLDRVVAMKVLNPLLSSNPDMVERFEREARAVARLNHPNVISGIDRGISGDIHYFVMEFASGTTVGKLLDRGGAIDESRVAAIATQIARALEHAHEAGLVHRDVKPDNILLTKDGIAKLCDLGLAKDRPEEGKSLGTPNYISPEQAKGLDVDIRSDLYSFGVTLYHMLAGSPPFSGNAKVVMVKHLSEQPQSLREIDSDITPEMERIVMKLMAKDPADRFQSPKHLIGELEHYVQVASQASAAPTVHRTRARRRRR